MSLEASSYITETQFAGYWCVAKVDNEVIQSLQNFSVDKKTATLAAKQLALNRQLPYQEDQLILTKPIVTIWKTEDQMSWVPVKIFTDRIEQAEKIATSSKEEARQNAKRLAQSQGLPYLPIGENMFSEVNI